MILGPQDLKEYLQLAAETALDLIPGGKVFKAFRGLTKQIGIKSIEKQLLKEAEKTAKKLKTRWGWVGAKAWKDLVNKVKRGGTIERLSGKIPTKNEAIKLIEEAGGKIQRIESKHFPPNPHHYNHINYTTPSGDKGTIRIQ